MTHPVHRTRGGAPRPPRDQAPRSGPGSVGSVGSAVSIALYRAPLDLDESSLALLTAPLSRHERARAASRVDALARRRFAADHGWRRRLLADWVGCEPTQITYGPGEDGKPFLAGGGPRFSATRSEGTALYAVSDEAEVGVDLEPVDETRDIDALARRVLSANERALYDALPTPERAAALFACWTRSEAHGKALGTGLVYPLSATTVWSAAAGSVRIGEVLVGDVALEPGLAGAVAVRTRGGSAGDPVLPRIPELLSL